MTDTRAQDNSIAQDGQHVSDVATHDENVVGDNAATGLPVNRIIRKRIAARTIGVHLSALPAELQALKRSSDSEYLTKYDLPDEIKLTAPDGERRVLSKDEAWEFVDEAGSKLEWDILPDSLAGKLTAVFSETGQGIYANYGRPSMDFTGFYHDYVCAPGQRLGNTVMLGPIFIAMDTASAIGFTALGHITRKASVANRAVLSDVFSTGVYEGTTSWTSAKLGVFTGARAIRLTATLPIPGAHLAAVPIGFLVGAATAIFTKHYANRYKDKAIDATYQSVMRSKSSRESIPA
jgi:hypothetical protein